MKDIRNAGYVTHGSGFMHADHHIDSEDPFAELGFTSYTCGPKKYRELVGGQVQRRYNMANTISEMWEHTYRNVEGQPFPYEENEIWYTLIADECIGFLEGASSQKPFFAYVGFRAPHPPWCAPERFHSMYDPNHIGEMPNYTVCYTDKPRRVIERLNYYELWNLPEEMIRKSIAAYYGFVSYLDHCIG